MARKNSPKDTSDVVFDTHSKVVMSQGGAFGRMKEKINAVRAVVPNRSNTEIVLVLQHFENCVDHAVQAFVEGSATEILKEWNITGKRKPKKKKKPKIQVEMQTEPVLGKSTPLSDGRDAVNGLHGNGSVLDGDSADSLSEQLESACLDTNEPDSRSGVPEPDEVIPGSRQSQGSQSGRASLRAHSGRVHFMPGCSTQQVPVSSQATQDDGQNTSTAIKKIAPNVDKSVKDLQRCTASLSRYRVVVKEEMDTSIKRMKQTFAELQSCLMDREVALLAEMDKVKAEALAILDTRQKKAEDLRRLSDQSGAMTEEQLAELRADIKHFVSERKYDEDLGKAVKFTHDVELLKKSIMTFGQVYHPQTGYSTRSRCSLAPAPAVCPPKAGVQGHTPPPTSGFGSSQGRKPGHQSSVQMLQGLAQEPGAQSFNGGGHQDRFLSRTGHRYQNSRGQAEGLDGNSRPSPLWSDARNGLAQSGTPTSRPRNTATNGLPQRAARAHRP